MLPASQVKAEVRREKWKGLAWEIGPWKPVLGRLHPCANLSLTSHWGVSRWHLFVSLGGFLLLEGKKKNHVFPELLFAGNTIPGRHVIAAQ